MARLNDFLKAAGSLAEGAFTKGVTLAKTFCRSDRAIVPSSSKSIDFNYVCTSSGKEFTGRMFYTDDYFLNPSTTYNLHLATASIAVAMSCANSISGYETGFRNVESLLGSMGFTDISHNESYETLSSLDTIGVAIGRRTLGNHTLLCMGIRGIGYGSEWGANLIIGTGRFHQGFDEASNRAIAYLGKYLSEYNVRGKIKLWVVGYSRSASTANLVAGKIDTAMAENTLSELIGNGIELSVEDLYAYCFEPAETVDGTAFDIHGADYGNIWNHINPNDPIPIMVTACFGMERFGTDVVLPCSSDSNYRGRRDRMLEFYRRLPNREELGHYRTDLFTTIRPKDFDDGEDDSVWDTQVNFLKDFNRKFVSVLESRERYAELMQPGLSKYVAGRNAYVGSERFKECFRQALSDNKMSLISALRALDHDDVNGIRNSIRKPVSEAVSEAGLDPSMVDELTVAVSELIIVFGDFLKNNKLLGFNFLVNVKTIFFAHYPELIFSWLMSMDDNYALS